MLRRYGADGTRLWNGKTPEEFTEADAYRFMAETEAVLQRKELMEHMHVMCTGHNGVTDAWYYKYSNVVFYTVFQNNIPIMAVDAAQKHCVDAVQHGKILDALPRRSCGDHFVLCI